MSETLAMDEQRRRSYLSALGIALWEPRFSPLAATLPAGALTVGSSAAVLATNLPAAAPAMTEERRRGYLSVLGIALWEPRFSPSPAVASIAPERTRRSRLTHAGAGLAYDERVRHAHLNALEVTHWEARFDPPPKPMPLSSSTAKLLATEQAVVAETNQVVDMIEIHPAPAAQPTPVLAVAAPRLETINTAPPAIIAPNWETLIANVSGCRACGLCETRTQTVFGSGQRDAALMLIGEAPGADEDRAGEPFVGRAGQLLTAMLAALGLTREQVYIANIVKCRPPDNRNPKVDEIAHCADYLSQQIALIQPRLLLALGAVAAQNLLHRTEAVGTLRGRWFEFGVAKIPLRVTYHPAYLLRSPEQKAKSWDDLVAVLQRLHTGANDTTKGVY